MLHSYKNNLTKQQTLSRLKISIQTMPRRHSINKQRDIDDIQGGQSTSARSGCRLTKAAGHELANGQVEVKISVRYDWFCTKMSSNVLTVTL